MCTRLHGPVNCIVPPHILRKLLENKDPNIRKIALNTLLATTALRAERTVVSGLAYLGSRGGKKKRRTIFDCKGRRILDEAEVVRGENDGPVSDQSVNDAFDGLGLTYDFYKEVHKRNSIDGKGMRLDGYVHYGQAYNNAFWDGKEMVFGDGDGELFVDFTRSLDVIAHELTHGVTEATAGLEYHNQSGALNESISDVFGSLVKQRHLGQTADQADWLIGSEIFTPAVEGDALRSLKAPGQAYNDPNLGRDPQPSHMDSYVQSPDTEEGDYGGVHINSGIPNHAFYLTATEIGGNAWEAPGHIWYKALRAANTNTDFQEFADLTYSAAGRLYGTSSREQQAVVTGWREVGVMVHETAAAPAGMAARTAERLMSIGMTEPNGGAIAQKVSKMAQDIVALRKELDQMKERKRETAKS